WLSENPEGVARNKGAKCVVCSGQELRIEVAGSEKIITDMKLAVYVACHSAISSVEDLCDILRKSGKGSNLENLKLYRTKCSKLITSVIAPAMLTELVEDIGNSGFSLIIDESKDVSVCIEYRATTAALHAAKKKYLESINLDLKNIIGLGTDGASDLCGRHNSVFTLFRAEVN
ncbi:Zinc finger MYM-type protein 1, partial [Frankliniella fusca]